MNSIFRFLNQPIIKHSFIRTIHDVKIQLPEPGTNSYWRIVHYPKEYTVKPLDTTNLAGRDPKTGRKVHNGIGGGLKHKYHWIDLHRIGTTEGPPLEEKVLDLLKCAHRSGHIALVGSKDKLKYIIATQNMKPGDIIKTSHLIPRIPVRGNEGDAHPLGALPLGTVVCCIEMFSGQGAYYAKAAGSYATIIRKSDDRVIIQLPSKHHVSLPQECMAVIGRVSNVEHSSIPIGSAQNLRYLGYRPRSGWWQRKDGTRGRKIKPIPPVLVVKDKPTKEAPLILSPNKPI